MWLELIEKLLSETNLTYLNADLPLAVFMVKLLPTRIKFDKFTNLQTFLDYLESSKSIELRYFIQCTLKDEINEDLDYSEWKSTIATTLDGTFLLVRWAAKHMRIQKAGLIVLLSSTAGLFGYPYRSPYAVAKWGIVGLTKTLAMEMGSDGIRVNCICPGAVEGDRMDRVVGNEAKARGVSEQTVRDDYVAAVSLKTWVTADDISNMVHFLDSPAGSKISGQALAVDGHTEAIT